MPNPVQIQKFLKAVDYPVSKQQLIDAAKKNGADQNVLDALEKIQEEHFQTPADVSEALGDEYNDTDSHADDHDHDTDDHDDGDDNDEDEDTDS